MQVFGLKPSASLRVSQPARRSRGYVSAVAASSASEGGMSSGSNAPREVTTRAQSSVKDFVKSADANVILQDSDMAHKKSRASWVRADLAAKGWPKVSEQDMRTSVHAVILAGGGSDNPLARHRAIPAFPLGATYRLIDVPISNCIRSNVNKIFVMTQFNSHYLHSYLAATYPPTVFGGRGQQGWVDVLTANQTPYDKEWFRGSADAVRRSLNELCGSHRGAEPPTDIVILAGETVYDLDYTDLVSYHRRCGADVTLATTTVSVDEASGFGVCCVDEGTCQVHTFVEKPSQAIVSSLSIQSHDLGDEECECSMGVYVFKREALISLLDRDPTASMDGRTAVDCHFGRDVLPRAVGSGYRVISYHYDGFWQNVSKLRDYVDVNLAMATSDPSVSLFRADHMIQGRGRMLPPTIMTESTHLNDALIGDGCMVQGATLQRCVIGNNSVICRGADIRDSLILGSIFPHTIERFHEGVAKNEHVPGIGCNTLIRNAVLDFNVMVGDNCQIVNRDKVLEADRHEDGYAVQDGIVCVFKDTILPAGTVI